MFRRFTAMHIIAIVVITIMSAACANIGRPEGGAKDELPPKFVRSNPMPGERNVNRNRVEIYFDENIKVEDAFSKVVVSPVQKQQPSIIANGKKITIDFRDTLNIGTSTTYTIDFADAIKDLNEGNILDGFAIDFSTGDSIDSLRISGMVLEASNLEPAQGMLVGVHSNLSDTAIHTLPFDRIARTNQYGQFTIRNLKPGKYNIFAIKDVNNDSRWDRSEDIAFYSTVVSPYTEPVNVTDTLYARDRSDSLVVRAGIKYLPNDILLSWFNENRKALYLKDYKRLDRRRIQLNYSAPSDTLPEIAIVDGAPGIGRKISQWGLVKANATCDTLEYWITDTAVAASDSLRLSIRHLRTDSTDNLVWKTDTLRFFYHDKEEKTKKKDKKNELTDSASIDSAMRANIEYLGIRAVSSATLDINRPFVIETSCPIADINLNGIKLETTTDSVWKVVPGISLSTDSSNYLQRRKINLAWKAGAKYRFKADSLAMKDVYGNVNRPFSYEFTIKNLEEYSGLIFRLTGLDSIPAVVQLLNTSDAPVCQAYASPDNPIATFKYLTPGTYYARLFLDANKNGKWDTGNLADSIQPEEVYYFAKKLQLKKNWDVDQAWDIYELPVDIQKPSAIKKNKPKLKRGEEQTEEEDEEDENGPYDPFSGRNNNRNNGNNPNNRNNGINRTGGGLRQAGNYR